MASPGTPRVPDVITDRTTGRRISLLDTKAANARASWLLFLAMIVLLGGVGYLLALAFDASGAIWFVGIAVSVAVIQSFVAWRYGDRMVLASTGARRATREEHRYLVNVSEAVSIGAGVPMPRTFVIDDPAPNAFATGRDPEHASIAVTTGLLDLLGREELEGVIAHEMAHVRNYDIRFMSLLAATVGALMILRDLVWRWMFFGRRRSGGGGKGQALVGVALLVVLIVAPILATLLRFAVSRRREYLADATGAYITRNPEGLARALEKLRDYRGEPLKVSSGVRHLFISNPAAHAKAAGLLSTHPPIRERIDRLRRM